jgi:hypothetical protein
MASKVILPKIKLSPPALLVLIGYIMLLAVVLLPADLYMWDSQGQRYMQVKYRLSHRIFMALYLLFPIALTTYTIQCIVTGKCITWSWILASVSFVSAIAFVLTNFTLAMGAAHA